MANQEKNKYQDFDLDKFEAQNIANCIADFETLGENAINNNIPVVFIEDNKIIKINEHKERIVLGNAPKRATVYQRVIKL